MSSIAHKLERHRDREEHGVVAKIKARDRHETEKDNRWRIICQTVSDAVDRILRLLGKD